MAGPKTWDDEVWYGVFALLLVVLSTLYLYGHNLYGLFDVDEAIFTQATVEMIESNNYIAPTYNGEPRYHKPPLIYWLQAASLNTFGEVTPLSARLPSALCAILAIIVLFGYVKALTKDPRVATTTSAVFGLSLLWLIVARAAIADAALNLLILWSTLQLLYLIYVSRGGFLGQIFAGVLLGLGLLAKGPIALFVPGLVGGLAVLLRPEFLRNIVAVNPLVILGSICLTIIPWLMMILQQNGLDFLHEFIWVHNIQRFFGGLNNTHSSSGFYYLIVLIIGFFPWVILLFAALPWVTNHIFDRLRSKQPVEALPALGLFWCIGVVLLFSFSKTKLPHYIVPALPGAALLIAGWLEDVPFKYKGRSMLRFGWPLVMLLGCVWLVIDRLLIAARPHMYDPLVNHMQSWFGFSWPPQDELVKAILAQDVLLTAAPMTIGIITIVLGLMGLHTLLRGLRQGLWVLALMQAMVLSLIVVGVMPMVYQYQQQPIAILAEELKNRYEPGQSVYHYRLHQPSMRLLSGLPFAEVHKPIQFIEILKTTPAFIFLEEHRVVEIEDALLEAELNLSITLDPVCMGGYCLLFSTPEGYFGELSDELDIVVDTQKGAVDEQQDMKTEFEEMTPNESDFQ